MATITGTALANLLNGSASADTINGLGGNDTLNGLGGNDTLNGGTGNDKMAGGLGNDTYVVDAALDVVTEAAGAGTDLVQASITYTLGANVENLTLTGAAAINGTGNTLANIITGNTGNNILNGGAGNDTLNGGLGNDKMIGGTGNDTYVRNATGDVVTEAAAGGTDLVQSAVAYTLGANVENLTLTGAGVINGTGNTLANVLTGNSAANVLNGGTGNDTLNGGLGKDTMIGGTGNDTLVWDALDTSVNGGVGTDTLRIDGAAQTLNLLTVANTKIQNVEVINLAGSGNNTLKLAASDVLAISSTTDTLRVDGDAGDTVQAGSGWTHGQNVVIGAQTYAEYTNGAATLQVDLDVNRSGVGVADVPLALLAGAGGFRIAGAADDQAGRSVSSAGDVNGDGFDDLLVGAHGYGASSNGAAYVVFGKSGGFTDMSLSALAASEGFRITGAANNDFAGFSVSSAGDVNGDGFDDLLVGAYRYGAYNGAAYVVFGHGGGFTNIDLSALAASDGFRITGAANDDYAGRSVSSAGDVNGDGFDDLLVGTQVYGDNNGAAYVVFGQSGGFTNLDLSALAASDGFRITGGANDDYAGGSVSSAGDVNGDGFDDILVGAIGYGATIGVAYVVFGQSGGFTDIDLSTLAANDGFRITGGAGGDYAGWSVSSAGDVNGDGLGDLLVGAVGYGANNGAAYVVFGQSGGFTNINLSTLAASDGFRITGGANGDLAGRSVSSAGDVNGDGFDDLLVGADGYGTNNGAAWVVFGQSGGFTDIDLSALAASDGFRITGGANGNFAGNSVSSAGDVDGDGFDDLLVGAHGYGAYSGAAYVVFGGDFRGEVDFAGTNGNDSLTGTVAAEILIGGRGNDTLTGGAGADVLKGGAGNDVLIYDAADGRADGGTGRDTLLVQGAGASIDLRASAETAISGIETINLTGSGDNALTLDAAGLVALTEGFHVLRVDGNAGDSVSAGSGWLYTGTIASGGQVYAQYTQGAAILQVDSDVGRTIGFGIDLSSFGGARGFQITGAANNDFAGYSVSSAGDVNGDGFDDLLVGANGYGASNNGAAYVVFGQSGGFTDIDLSALAASDGFRITGGANGDLAGCSVSSAGDVNGDGFDDILVGAYHYGADDNGAAYVVFGHSGGFTNISLSALDAADGFRITGGVDGDYAGRSVSSAGDVNGDGFDEFIVGAFGYGASSNGAAYVVFGQSGGFTDIDFSGFAFSDGFMITGEAIDDYAGRSVSSAGDVNGDGFDDLLVGAHFYGADRGAAYVVFGQSGGFTVVSLSALGAGEGFRIAGEADDGLAGASVSSAGDVNGDGFDDIFVGAFLYGADDNGAAYVVFGHSGGFTNISLSALDAAEGFRITGATNDDNAGFSVSSAGDVNGDGFDDLLVGAYRYGAYNGAAYVVFGQSGGFTDIDLSTLTASEGFRITGGADNDSVGRSVSSAGDVNGDGFDDLLVGANGYGAANNGAAYVLFGADFRGEVDFLGGADNNIFTGTAAAEILIGGQGDDTLAGGAGADVLIGGAGNDVLIYDAADRKVDGGSGEDTLAVAGADVTVTLGAGHSDLEVIDLTGSGDNAVVLSVRDVLDLSSTTNTLRVDGNDGDQLISTGQGWLIGEAVDIGGVTYQSYTRGAATLLADTDLLQIVS